jgi:hypothetical protein
MAPRDLHTQTFSPEPALTNRVRARLWVYPPGLRMGNPPGEAIRAAARNGVDLEMGDVSIGIAGNAHGVFGAIEEIFNGLADGTDLALIVTIRRNPD